MEIADYRKLNQCFLQFEIIDTWSATRYVIGKREIDASSITDDGVPVFKTLKFETNVRRRLNLILIGDENNSKFSLLVSDRCRQRDIANH